MAAGGVSLLAAFVGGVASFSSPCILPLVPAYLSVVGGLDLARDAPARRDRAADVTPATAGIPAAAGATSVAAAPQGPTVGREGSVTSDVARRRRTRPLGRVTLDTALFIMGFGTVFVLLGLSASALGRAVVHQETVLTRISGVVVVAMALFLFGTLFWRSPGLFREWRLHPRLQGLGPFAAPVAGAAFAFGWTPCVGPILASVLALSATQGRAGAGALLLAVYTLGLGTPFLVVAVLFDHVRAPLAWLRRHASGVTAVSSLLLGVLGVLLVLDRLALVTTIFQRVG